MPKQIEIQDECAGENSPSLASVPGTQKTPQPQAQKEDAHGFKNESNERRIACS